MKCNIELIWVQDQNAWFGYINGNFFEIKTSMFHLSLHVHDKKGAWFIA